MKKNLVKLLIFTVTFTSVFFGAQPTPKAQAALSVGQKMGSLVYHTQLRRYLLSKGVSTNMVNLIMSWARDPNSDGSYSDGIIEMPNSSDRLTAMRNKAKSGFHPSPMKEWVIPWEVKWHFTIIPDNLSPDDNSSVGDIFWPTMAVKLSDTFPEFRVVGDYQTGDDIVRALAYERKPSGIPGVPPRLVLQAKTKLSATAKDRLYGIRQSDGTWKGEVRRFIPFRYTKDAVNWTAEETSAMNNAISFQNSVEERMAKRGITDDPSQNNWNYQISKISVGTWDAILMAANVIPLLKGKKILGLVKVGAEGADAVSKTAKITVNGQQLAASTSLINGLTSETKNLTGARANLAVSFIDGTVNGMKRRFGKYSPRIKNLNYWSEVDTGIVHDLKSKSITTDKPVDVAGLVTKRNGRTTVLYNERIFTNLADQDVLRYANGEPMLHPITGQPYYHGTAIDQAFDTNMHETIHLFDDLVGTTRGGVLAEALTTYRTRVLMTERGMSPLKNAFDELALPIEGMINGISKANGVSKAKLNERFFEICFQPERENVLSAFFQQSIPRAPADFFPQIQSKMEAIARFKNAVAYYDKFGPPDQLEIFQRQLSETKKALDNYIRQYLPTYSIN